MLKISEQRKYSQNAHFFEHLDLSKMPKNLGNKKFFSTIVYLEVEFKFQNCPIFLKHIWKFDQIFLKIRIFKISKFGSKMEKVQPI